MLFIIFIITIATAIVESTFIPIPLTFILISAVIIKYGDKSSILCFSSGLILDILTLKLLGTNSLFFTVICLLISRYQKKVNVSHNIYIIIFLGFIQITYNYLNFRYSNIYSYIVTLITGWLLIYTFTRFIPQEASNRKKLTL